MGIFRAIGEELIKELEEINMREEKLLQELEDFSTGKREMSESEFRDIADLLLKEFNRKSKRLDRILKQSDRQQIELDRYKTELEERVENAVKEIKSLNNEIVETQKEILFKMGAIGESRSKETGNHVRRVAYYSYILAKKYGLNEESAKILRDASPMHDIGKVAIPDNILHKPGKLTDEEFKIMKDHSQIGYDLLKYSKRPLLQTASIVAYQHHEKWNGRGYPRGLKGSEIHVYGRITAIADVFDALGSDRVYKKAWKLERILELFRIERGEHFDPKLVDIFFDNLDDFLKIRSEFKDECDFED
jgi:response regulator RpfG family c-di-GMP phosphodiesterase